MNTQILERQDHRQAHTQAPSRQLFLHPATRTKTASTSSTAQHELTTPQLDLETELQTLTQTLTIEQPESITPELITDTHELGQRIMSSAMSNERETFAIKCRSVSHATQFATPMRSILLALTSGFGSISLTISPSLNLNTWPAMDRLVAALEQAGAGDVWQLVGERSIGLGAARNLFLSVDNPIQPTQDDSTRVFPNLLVEVVGAHLIDPNWFDRIVEPRCRDLALTFVFYGQAGHSGSLFERALQQSNFQGLV